MGYVSSRARIDFFFCCCFVCYEIMMKGLVLLFLIGARSPFLKRPSKILILIFKKRERERERERVSESVRIDLLEIG